MHQTVRFRLAKYKCYFQFSQQFTYLLIFFLFWWFEILWPQVGIKNSNSDSTNYVINNFPSLIPVTIMGMLLHLKLCVRQPLGSNLGASQPKGADI